MKTSSQLRIDSTIIEIRHLKLLLHEILLTTDLALVYKTICNYQHLRFSRPFMILASHALQWTFLFWTDEVLWEPNGGWQNYISKILPSLLQQFQGPIPCISATLCKLFRSKCYKMLICEGCCVVIGACETTPPCPARPFQRLKNPAETILNLEITFPQKY